MNNEVGLRELKDQLTMLEWIDGDPKVNAARAIVRTERMPRINALKAKIAELQAKRPGPKPRWPENTPANVLAVCNLYWRGTTEFYTFRIHCWNDKFVCTSYPSGGYSDNGGWHPTSACFHFLSLTEREYGRIKRVGSDLEGRQSAKQLEVGLNERTKI